MNKWSNKKTNAAAYFSGYDPGTAAAHAVSSALETQRQGCRSSRASGPPSQALSADALLSDVQQIMETRSSFMSAFPIVC